MTYQVDIYDATMHPIADSEAYSADELGELIEDAITENGGSTFNVDITVLDDTNEV